MPRLSIDVTDQQHQKLKAMAALKGLSIKQFVLQQTLEGTPDVSAMSDDQAMSTLKAILNERAMRAQAGDVTSVPPGRLLDHLKGISRSAND